MNRAKRNKLLLAILAIALFIPTVVAIVNYSRAKTGPVNTSSIVTLTMSDLNGDTVVFDKENPDTEKIVEIFVNMKDTATTVTALPDALGSKPFYLIDMSNGSLSYRYQYYFDTTGRETYFLDGDGNAYMVNAEAVSEFLSTKYAASVYSGGEMPKLTISASADNVLPTTASWAFRDAVGGTVEVDCTDKVTSETVVYPVEGGMETSFSITPDYLHVEITSAEKKDPIYNGDYENGALFKFDTAVKADVTINAKWYHDDSRDYEGEMTYNFVIEIEDGASFYLGAETIDTGEAVAITGINVKDPSKIVFTSSPDIGYDPTFYTDGKYVRAIVPIALERQGDTTYKFTIKYGAATQTLDLKVNYRDYERGTANTYYVTDDIAALFTDETKNAAKNAMLSVFETGSEEKYFDGGFFGEAVNGGITRYFGRTYTVSPGNVSYRQNGIEYYGVAGANVSAVGRGKVVYVGNLDVTGNVIVIEHGYGLKTLYAHLGTVSVKVGDIVEKGASIGTCGMTGFTNTTGVYFATFVGTVPISPYTMWSDGNWKTFPNPEVK